MLYQACSISFAWYLSFAFVHSWPFLHQLSSSFFSRLFLLVNWKKQQGICPPPLCSSMLMMKKKNEDENAEQGVLSIEIGFVYFLVLVGPKMIHSSLDWQWIACFT